MRGRWFECRSLVHLRVYRGPMHETLYILDVIYVFSGHALLKTWNMIQMSCFSDTTNHHKKIWVYSDSLIHKFLFGVSAIHINVAWFHLRSKHHTHTHTYTITYMAVLDVLLNLLGDKWLGVGTSTEKQCGYFFAIVCTSPCLSREKNPIKLSFMTTGGVSWREAIWRDFEGWESKRLSNGLELCQNSLPHKTAIYINLCLFFSCFLICLMDLGWSLSSTSEQRQVS